MMSTWYIFSLHEFRELTSPRNKFCFTGGYIEANVSLPGVNNVVGKVFPTKERCQAEMNATKGFGRRYGRLGTSAALVMVPV